MALFFIIVSSGVLQSTVLGPTLFLLYINAIDTTIQNQVRVFADDCLIHRPTYVFQYRSQTSTVRPYYSHPMGYHLANGI